MGRYFCPISTSKTAILAVFTRYSERPEANFASWENEIVSLNTNAFLCFYGDIKQCYNRVIIQLRGSSI